MNRSLDLRAARARGWAIVRDSAHRFRLATHYTTPACQLRQLEEAGFTHIEVLDRSGKVVVLDRPSADSWLYYHCEL